VEGRDRFRGRHGDHLIERGSWFEGLRVEGSFFLLQGLGLRVAWKGASADAHATGNTCFRVWGLGFGV